MSWPTNDQQADDNSVRCALKEPDAAGKADGDGKGRDGNEEDAAKQVAGLQRQLVDLAAAQTKGERAVSDKRSTLAELNLRETGLMAKMGDNRNQLARLLGALELFCREPPPEPLRSAVSAGFGERASGATSDGEEGDHRNAALGTKRALDSFCTTKWTLAVR